MHRLIRFIHLIPLSGILVLGQGTQSQNAPGNPEPDTSFQSLESSVSVLKNSFCRICLIAIDDFSDAEPGVQEEDAELTNVMRQMLSEISDNAYGGGEIPENKRLPECKSLTQIFLTLQLQDQIDQKGPDQKILPGVPQETRAALMNQYLDIIDEEGESYCDDEYKEHQLRGLL